MLFVSVRLTCFDLNTEVNLQQEEMLKQTWLCVRKRESCILNIKPPPKPPPPPRHSSGFKQPDHVCFFHRMTSCGLSFCSFLKASVMRSRHGASLCSSVRAMMYMACCAFSGTVELSDSAFLGSVRFCAPEQSSAIGWSRGPFV